MRAVDLEILKQRLSEDVRIATSGETTLVTDRERVVAELGPPREGRSVVAGDARQAEAVRRGWLSPALGSTGGPGPRRPVTTWMVSSQRGTATASMGDLAGLRLER